LSNINSAVATYLFLSAKYIILLLLNYLLLNYYKPYQPSLLLPYGGATEGSGLAYEFKIISLIKKDY
jgi:hypothetical protein